MGHSLLNGLEGIHGKQECRIAKEKPPRHCALAASHTQLAIRRLTKLLVLGVKGQYHGCKKNQA